MSRQWFGILFVAQIVMPCTVTSGEDGLFPWSQYRESGFYLGGIASLAQPQDQLSTGPERRVDIDFNHGFGVGGVVGYRFPRTWQGRWRIEGDFVYRSNGIDGLVFNNVDQSPTGQTDSYASMLNVVFDFDKYIYVDSRFLKTELTPYVGFGMGFVVVDQSVRYGTAVFTDSDTAFGFQPIVGTSIRVTQDVELFAEFRYLGTANVSLARFGGPAPVRRVNLESEYGSFDFLGGIRVNLR